MLARELTRWVVPFPPVWDCRRNRPRKGMAAAEARRQQPQEEFKPHRPLLEIARSVTVTTSLYGPGADLK
ncbi:hypothetical protein O988_06414 [Pseudogymnoascus sp. VKM F-3808]|nr:hypothetical protein O988_06414 [Pseudogymnoascus sp. VKM F-3808]